MMKLKHNFKKGMAFVLSLAMVAGLVPAMSGGADTVQAATGSGTEPSVTAYATKDQLMTAFTPDANGTATTKGKLVFGKKSDGTTAQEWYILGKDEGVSGDNTIIFAANPIATGQKFNSSTSNKSFASSFGVYASNPSEVYPNHYGASDLRVALQRMATNTNYFTIAEQGLMNPTTVTTKDTMNSATYTTTDKLYGLAGDENATTIKAGSGNNTVLAMGSYWNSEKYFWLRSPNGDNSRCALFAHPGNCVRNGGVRLESAVQPASNLNLSSVLFASAATAASSDTKSEKITDSAAMTLRLDGTGKDIGTVTYNTTTGDIKVVKGTTSQTVALVVQGNDGTNDWYYSKQITGTETINVSAIEAESNTPASINLSACKIWLEITEDNVTYAVNATETVVSEISSVAITDIDTPAANTALDTSASCITTGVNSIAPQITWTPNDTTAGYNTSYTASITLTADTDYEFTDSTTATINGNTATSVNKNADGTLKVTYAFPATAKDKLTSITAPQPITVANRTAYDAMNLPATVNIVTEGNTESSAQVTWDTTTPAGGNYDPSVLTEQTVTLKGTVTCPDSIDANGVELTTTITITISAAGIVGAPTANPTAGAYTENQSVALASSTVGATIYYTTDGSEPTITGGATGGTTAEYTAPIAVTGTEGRSITTTVKAIAVKNGMQDSSVETFTYTIQIPVPKYTVTVTNGSGTGQYAQGETVTITAGAAPSGQQFKEWEVVSGTITLASSTSETTTFTMPTEAVSVKANYEAATSNITSVAITDIDTPAANTALDTSASCTTTGVSSTTPQITWTPNDTTAGYNTSYTASITLTADTDYEFTDSTTATVLGNSATSVTKNADGTLTVTYAFPATAKDKLTSITAPQAITVANGTAYDAMNLPATVNIVTEGNTASSAQVTWDTTTPAGGSYDPAVLTQQTVTLNGMVDCPNSIDANGVSLTTTITITISAAGIVGAPIANPTAGTYSENQSVALTSSTVGATIYYTTDGSEPTITGGAPDGTTQQYTAPIAVTGTVGQSITITIKAIAVKNDMQDSSVGTFIYTIKQDSQTPDVPGVTAPSITTQPDNATVKAGETATFIIAASGTDLTYLWQIDRNDGNGWVNIDGATAAIYTTSSVDISCNGFKYQCVVSNSAGTDTSNTAVLTVTENTTPAPGSVDYEILDGANTSWEQNSDGSLSIRGSGAISKFMGVKVDGNLVDVKNYTVKEGSTIVTLKADYLNTLSVGNHTFEIIWTDGTASTGFTVSKSDSGSDEPKDNDGNNGKNDNTNNTPATAPEDKNNNGTSGSQTDDNQQITAPKTGDNSHTVLWISLLGVSLAGLLSMIYVRKKKENK